MTINHPLNACRIDTTAGNQAFGFDGYQNVTDFALIDDTSVTNMVKVMRTIDERGYNLGAMQVEKLRALVFWLHNFRQRQLSIPHNGFHPQYQRRLTKLWRQVKIWMRFLLIL